MTYKLQTLSFSHQHIHRYICLYYYYVRLPATILTVYTQIRMYTYSQYQDVCQPINISLLPFSQTQTHKYNFSSVRAGVTLPPLLLLVSLFQLFNIQEIFFFFIAILPIFYFVFSAEIDSLFLAPLGQGKCFFFFKNQSLFNCL